MHARIIELIRNHMDYYHDPLLISQVNYNKFIKGKSKEKLKKLIRTEKKTFSMSYNSDDIKHLDFVNQNVLNEKITFSKSQSKLKNEYAEEKDPVMNH